MILYLSSPPSCTYTHTSVHPHKHAVFCTLHKEECFPRMHTDPSNVSTGQGWVDMVGPVPSFPLLPTFLWNPFSIVCILNRELSRKLQKSPDACPRDMRHLLGSKSRLEVWNLQCPSEKLCVSRKGVGWEAISLAWSWACPGELLHISELWFLPQQD